MKRIRIVSAVVCCVMVYAAAGDFVWTCANGRPSLGKLRKCAVVRNIFSFEVKKDGPRITFIVQGDGFLYKQVRSMVGYLIRVGLGEEKPETVTWFLDTKPARTARVPTALARGLFLWKVFY